MSVAGVVEDLIALQLLAEQERDAVRRRSLDAIRGHVAERDGGAKVGEADEADDGLPVLKKPAQRAGNVEVDLSNKDIYASLFKSVRASLRASVS